MKTKDVFCANCQDVTPHEVTIGPYGEYEFTCDCGRFIKFPGDIKDLAGALQAHETGNKGQISIEAQQKALEEKLAAIK